MKTFALEFKGLSRKIFLSFSILIFAILIFQEAATYYVMQATVHDINSNYIAVGLRQKNEKMNNFIKEIDLFSKTIISDRDMQELLLQNKDTGSNLKKISHEIEYALSNNIDAVFLVSNNGNIYREADNELGEYVSQHITEIKSEVAKSSGEMQFLDSRFINYASDIHGDYFFFVARKVRSIDTFEDIGIMIIAIRESALWKSISMEGDLGNFYIINSKGRIVSCKNKELVEKDISTELGDAVQEKEYNFTKGPYVAGGLVINNLLNENTNWNLLSAVTIEEINSNYLNVQRIILVIGVAAIIIAVYISILISGKITRPIRDMIFSMKKVIAGNLDVQTDIALTKDSTDEVKELNYVFNQMTRQLQNLIEEVYHEGKREKEAELRALKAQINPHFLYNTLDTVYWMLIDKSDYDIADIVTKLGEILRYSIKKGSTNVKVREEIQQVENYLFIQKARFEDSLDYEVHIDDNILECEILSFIIQPFVENAINHGIMQDKGHGRVLINGFCREEKIIFEIIDDGAGMSKEQIDNLYHKKTDRNQSHGGIGVLNVHDRIKYNYGEEYGVRIESQKGSGTRVIVEIPLANPEEGVYEA